MKEAKMEISLKDICINKVCYMIKKSLPKKSEESKSIENYINQLPKSIILDMEQTFFNQYIEFNRSIKELQYLLWYQIFLQKSCTRFWLNKTFDQNLSSIPLLYAVERGHTVVVKALLDTLKDDENFVDLNMVQKGKTAYGQAVLGKRFQIARMLLKTLDNEDPRKRIVISNEVRQQIMSTIVKSDHKINIDMIKWLSKETYCSVITIPRFPQ